MWEIKSTSHKQYLFGIFFSVKAKKDSYRPKYTSGFLICLNLNDSQIFKSSSRKNGFLQCVYYRCSLLWWKFFVPCDSWKTLFFLKICRYSEVFSTAILSFSLKQVFWKKSVFYIISTITVQSNTDVNANFQNKAIVYYTHTDLKNIRSWLFYDNVFYTLYFMTVPHFSL